jgi:hypothetical protein
MLFYTDENTVALQPAPPKKRRRRWPWAAAAAAVLIVVIAILGAVNKRRTEALAGVEETFRQQFNSADANADGYLTPEEVRGRFPVIAKEFARVDGDNDGRISMKVPALRRQQFARKPPPK